MLVYVLDENRTLVGTVGETLTSLEFTRRWQGTDSAKLVINRRRAHAAELSTGRFLYLPTEGHRLFYIEQILTHEEAGAQKDLREVHARGMEGPTLEERLVDPRPAAYDTQSGVAAETAMKHYVFTHAGLGAAVARRFTGLAIAADTAVGDTVNVEARFQRVADIIKAIGLPTNMGWQYTFDPVAKTFVFDVIPGVDRQNSVFMDIDFATISEYEELFSLLDSKTAVLVAGQGEGTARDLVDRYAGGVAPSGFARREAFIDARDVPPGGTPALQDRGDAALAELAPEKRYEAEVHAFGSFRYRTHWDLGDIVRLRNQELGVSEPVRVVSVTTKVAGATASPERTVELGRAMPTLKERVTPGVSSVSAQGTVDLPFSHSHPRSGDLKAVEYKAQTGDLALTATYTTIPGMTFSPVASDNEVWVIIASCTARVSTASASSTIQVQCVVDGVAQTHTLQYRMDAIGGGTIAGSWRVAVAAGARSVVIQAKRGATGAGFMDFTTAGGAITVLRTQA